MFHLLTVFTRTSSVPPNRRDKHDFIWRDVWETSVWTRLVSFVETYVSSSVL